MVSRLPAWLFMALALLIAGVALIPLVRFFLGIDSQISLSFSVTVMLLITALMSGLTAMLLLVRRQPILASKEVDIDNVASKSTLLAIHSSNLLLFTGIPLFNFLIAYWLWVKNRALHPDYDHAGRQVLNYQISMYLYLLLSLFLIIAVLGLLTTPALLAVQLLISIWALTMVMQGKRFNYPISIDIITKATQATTVD